MKRNSRVSFGLFTSMSCITGSLFWYHNGFSRFLSNSVKSYRSASTSTNKTRCRVGAHTTGAPGFAKIRRIFASSEQPDFCVEIASSRPSHPNSFTGTHRETSFRVLRESKKPCPNIVIADNTK
ncbi:hypothetical protein O0L34_g7816 [Tuta absoluta]|nr:hypothetical protein O0L34_g7816 [Tuta absoluta]